MKATVVDLRYRMNDVLRALARNEKVTVYYHGQEKGIIIPVSAEKEEVKVEDTPLFGMHKGKRKSVNKIMKELRGGRYSDI